MKTFSNLSTESHRTWQLFAGHVDWGMSPMHFHACHYAMRDDNALRRTFKVDLLCSSCIE